MKREFTPQARNLAMAIFNAGAVKCDSYYTLKLHEEKPDAPKSPIFFNLRTPENPKPGPLTPEIVREIAELFYAHMQAEGICYDFIAGVPNAADPFVDALCDIIPGGWEKRLYLTKKTHEDGKRSIATLTDESVDKIEPGKIVLLFDDLVTRATSKLEAITVLEIHGLQVYDVIVFLDREQGGREELEEAEYKLHSIFPVSDLLALYHEEQLITDAKYFEIISYLEQNS
jgi:orotate phosphoribosyltransferase